MIPGLSLWRYVTCVSSKRSTTRNGWIGSQAHVSAATGPGSSSRISISAGSSTPTRAQRLAIRTPSCAGDRAAARVIVRGRATPSGRQDQHVAGKAREAVHEAVRHVEMHEVLDADAGLAVQVHTRL